MGWTVLYIAFGVVALWLLAEVLLQYKARLRWRLLAFTGFLGVVAGVVFPSVAVIVVGAIAFAVGQTFVTLSFRRGFTMGWALRRGDAPDAPPPTAAPAPGGRAAARSGRRRKGERRGASAPAPTPAPAPDVTLPAGGPGALTAVQEPSAAEATALLDPVLDAGVPQQPTAEQPHPAGYPAPGQGGYDYGRQPAAETPAHDGVPAGQFDYGQGQYASYSDPYIGNRAPSYDQYDAYGQQQPYGQQGYASGGYGQGAYGGQRYDMDTPPGGVWVPQQRDTDAAPQAGQQPPYPPQHLPGQGQGHDEQPYRY
ncbi:hypothetical protein [Streptomyces sp. NPDC049555]|uniref:hypothetical protein n=1 Tax=Streptomyces sp. NPDC049555 TaxID=3154930 RepID=UPI003432071B